MNKLICILMATFLLIGCDEDYTPSIAERNVVSEDESIPFEELLILFNIKSTDSTYLIVESIDSVTIYVNNKYWATMSSEPVDTTKINKTINGNKFQSQNKMSYLVIANENIEQPDYRTAGDFAQYLNSSLDLEPGEYVCLIESFQLTFNDGTVKMYYPFAYSTFKVEKDSRSAFVGEIDLIVN